MEEFSLLGWDDFEKEIGKHKRCKDPELEECIYCGYADCPHDEPLHYHHDGCPACVFEEDCIEDSANVQNTSNLNCASNLNKTKVKA